MPVRLLSRPFSGTDCPKLFFLGPILLSFLSEMYHMLCYSIVRYCIAFHCIIWYILLPYGIEWYRMVSYVIIWYPISLHAISLLASARAGCVSQDAYLLHSSLNMEARIALRADRSLIKLTIWRQMENPTHIWARTDISFDIIRKFKRANSFRNLIIQPIFERGHILVLVSSENLKSQKTLEIL